MSDAGRARMSLFLEIFFRVSQILPSVHERANPFPSVSRGFPAIEDRARVVLMGAVLIRAMLIGVVLIGRTDPVVG